MLALRVVAHCPVMARIQGAKWRHILPIGCNSYHAACALSAHLVDTLQALDVDQADTDEVIEYINSFANEITGTSY